MEKSEAQKVKKQKQNEPNYLVSCKKVEDDFNHTLHSLRFHTFTFYNTKNNGSFCIVLCVPIAWSPSETNSKIMKWKEKYRAIGNDGQLCNSVQLIYGFPLRMGRRPMMMVHSRIPSGFVDVGRYGGLSLLQHHLNIQTHPVV
ncbi:hypothetical protein BLOT_011053, partial [Blomia tropicalis]